MFKKTTKTLLAVLVMMSTYFSMAQFAFATPYNPNTYWFMNAKYGVFVHYLNHIQNGVDQFGTVKNTLLTQGKAGTSWDEVVNDFNVNTFADQMEQAGAKYVIFTVQQVSQYMIAPNATYDQYTGYQPGEATSHRDLISDLYDALNPKDIKLMLYWTGDGPRWDEKASAGLGYSGINDTFVKRWSNVAKEYSLRYGNKIAGWWVDGCYSDTGSGSDYNTARLQTLSDALKAGNPNAIVALNPGITDPVRAYGSSFEDYTAGEHDSLPVLPTSRFVNGEQWHTLTHLGKTWANTDLQFSNSQIIDYLQNASSIGAVVSLDVALFRDGSIGSDSLSQLQAIKAALSSVHRKPYNLSLTATATASSQFNSNYVPSKAIDNSIASDWASLGELNPWIRMDWSSSQTINKITFNDRPNGTDWAPGGTLTFSDGSSVTVTGIPNDGSAYSVTFPDKTVTWVKFQVSGGSGSNVGLAEFQAYRSTNVASTSITTASSSFDSRYTPDKAIDGIISQHGTGEWASLHELNPWIKLDWNTSQLINKITFYDRPNTTDWTPGGTLTFSDGSTLEVTGIPNDGSAYSVTFPNKYVSWVKFQVANGSGSNVGLSELKVFSDGILSQPVTGITLSANALTLSAGQIYSLKPIILPLSAINQAVSWSSSNPSVATVNSSGVVTAVANGSATITVTTADGNKTDTSAITVAPPPSPVPVTGVSLSPSSATLDINTVMDLTPTIAPSNATNQKATWSSNKPSVATVVNGVVRTFAAGSALITVTTADGSYTATSSITVIHNLVGTATATASSVFNSNYAASKAIDGVTGVHGSGEWASLGQLNPWLQLDWSSSQTMNKITFFDRPNTTDWAPGGTLTFSDGSSLTVTGIPNDGSAYSVTFPNKTVTWVRFQVSGGSGSNVGLSEMQVYAP
ncbi:DUF7402 domain-containing protein [Cohnella soli]|uniref:Ig-like domain-containing protein n=1 Tax=Cohnella soli TaxID=425005 RepID=A0ABW0HYJ3_9BACL